MCVCWVCWGSVLYICDLYMVQGLQKTCTVPHHPKEEEEEEEEEGEGEEEEELE